LKQLLGGFEEGQNKIGRFEVEIAEYYRLVRNGFAHDGADGAVKKTSRVYVVWLKNKA